MFFICKKNVAIGYILSNVINKNLQRIVLCYVRNLIVRLKHVE